MAVEGSITGFGPTAIWAGVDFLGGGGRDPAPPGYEWASQGRSRRFLRLQKIPGYGGPVEQPTVDELEDEIPGVVDVTVPYRPVPEGLGISAAIASIGGVTPEKAAEYRERVARTQAARAARKDAERQRKEAARLKREASMGRGQRVLEKIRRSPVAKAVKKVSPGAIARSIPGGQAAFAAYVAYGFLQQLAGKYERYRVGRIKASEVKVGAVASSKEWAAERKKWQAMARTANKAPAAAPPRPPTRAPGATLRGGGNVAPTPKAAPPAPPVAPPPAAVAAPAPAPQPKAAPPAVTVPRGPSGVPGIGVPRPMPQPVKLPDWRDAIALAGAIQGAGRAKQAAKALARLGAVTIPAPLGSTAARPATAPAAAQNCTCKPAAPRGRKSARPRRKCVSWKATVAR